MTDSDNVPNFAFDREQQGGALSASTGSDAFTMQSLSTNGSSSDDLDELLTWLDKDGKKRKLWLGRFDRRSSFEYLKLRDYARILRHTI